MRQRRLGDVDSPVRYLAGGQYTLDVTMDGRKQECTLRTPNDSPTGYESCGGGVRMEFTSNVNDFVLRVLVDSTPKGLGLRLSRKWNRYPYREPDANLPREPSQRPRLRGLPIHER